MEVGDFETSPDTESQGIPPHSCYRRITGLNRMSLKRHGI